MALINSKASAWGLLSAIVDGDAEGVPGGGAGTDSGGEGGACADPREPGGGGGTGLLVFSGCFMVPDPGGGGGAALPLFSIKCSAAAMAIPIRPIPIAALFPRCPMSPMLFFSMPPRSFSASIIIMPPHFQICHVAVTAEFLDADKHRNRQIFHVFYLRPQSCICALL